MNKMEGTSLDLEKLNIEKIKELFPNVVTEGKVDFDKLRIILGDQIDDRVEKYQFTWNGKSDTIKLAQTPSTGTLIPSKEDSKNWDTTGNLYIEGDNLEVLKQLQKTYYGKVKMIYIDPPYNTGGDFVYKDDFKDNIKNYKEQTQQTSRANPETNGRYHTDWLNMMYSRLMLAKNLLSDDGVIFISIDDHELYNLRNICNEIFGENNYVAQLSVENNPKGRKNSNYISVSNDFALIYSRNIDKSYFIENIPKNLKDLTKDENGNYVHNSGKRILIGEQEFNNVVSNFDSAKHYSVYYSSEVNDIIIKKEYELDEIDDDLISDGYERYYSFFDGAFVENTYTEAKFQELFDENAIEFKNNKAYEKNMSTTIRLKSMLINKEYSAVINNTVVDFKMDFKTTSAGTQLKNLFNLKKTPFDAPKNVNFIKLLMTLFDQRNFTVLDFFSGSSTTAHAVMQLNAEDGGTRNFIMVQLPEILDKKQIAYKAGFRTITDIAKERIRRAGEQIKQELIEKKSKAGLLDDNIVDPETFDNGFKVFKLDSTNINPWDGTIKLNEETIFSQTEVIKEDRSNLDVLYEIMLKYGVFDKPAKEIKVNTKTMYSVADGYLIVCLDNNITLDDVKEIGKLKPRNVIFKESGFANDNDKINATYTLEKLGVEEIKSI